jgi:hypothetical protein
VDIRNCDDLIARALADAKSQGWDLEVVSQKQHQCNKGSYKIVAVLAPGNDFHWYRHHRDLLYRVKRPRTIRELAAEFRVPVEAITIPGNSRHARVGDIALIKNANVWSHKQGFSSDGPLLKDACGKIIKDPSAACRSYGNGLNYTVVCATFCFRKRT